MTQRVVTYTYGTGNPVLPDGSIDVRDGIDNLQSLDILMNSTDDTYNQRDGKIVHTVTGALKAVGFKPGAGDFTTGFTVMPGERDVAWYDPVSKNWYSYLGVIPTGGHPVAPGVNPVGDSDWSPRTDETLRTNLLSQDGSSLIGTVQSGPDAVARTVESKINDEISSKDFDVKSDGATIDRANIIKAMANAVATGRTLVIEDGVSLFDDWVPIPSGLKMRFKPNAVWKLTQATNLGGFICCGYNETLQVVDCNNVEIYDMTLDCNNIAGENAYNGVRGRNIKFYNPKAKNVIHSPVSLGGRAFQFEGDLIDGVHVYQPYLENCSIGINSQGSPTGSETVVNINYYDVVMRNVDVPFNVDSQFANPETNTPYTMSTFVHGASLFNCGKLTFPGNSDLCGGGIICGDRGYGLQINDLKIVNDITYGGIGSLTRGTLFGVHIDNCYVYAPSLTAVFDYTPCGFGAPSAAAFPSTITTSGAIRVDSNLDYIVKSGNVAGRIGKSCLRGIEIDSVKASLAGLVDANSGLATDAMLEVSLFDNKYKSTGLKTLKGLYDRGNSVQLCQGDPTAEEGEWTPVDASGAGLALTIQSGTARYVKNGNWITAKAHITYPTNSNGANVLIGGLPESAINLGSFAGAGTIGYTTEADFAGIYVVGNTKTIQASTSTGTPLTNSAMSGDVVMLSVTYQVGV